MVTRERIRVRCKFRDWERVLSVEAGCRLLANTGYVLDPATAEKRLRLGPVETPFHVWTLEVEPDPEGTT